MHPLRTLRTLSLAALPAIAALAGAWVSPMAHAAAPACVLHRVYSVTSINLVMRGPRVMLTVTGMAASAGWHGAILRPTPRTGAAGVARYVLLACAPGFSAQVMTPIAATRVLHRPLDGLRRIEVRAVSDRRSLDVGRPRALRRRGANQGEGRTSARERASGIDPPSAPTGDQVKCPAQGRKRALTFVLKTTR